MGFIFHFHFSIFYLSSITTSACDPTCTWMRATVIGLVINQG
jgi:hypothetical protein